MWPIAPMGPPIPWEWRDRPPTSMSFLMIGFSGCDAFVEQGRILLSVEEAGFWITMFLLPVDDSATGRLVEFAVGFGLKPEPG